MAGKEADLKLGAVQDCEENPNCLPGLKSVYGIDLSAGFTPLEAGPALAAALEAGEIHVAVLFSTDGVIADKGFVILEDDKALLKADNITPVASNAVVEAYKGKPVTDHMTNFFNCVKSREEPISDIFSHHRALSTCHLANIAMRLDREIKWDPEKEEIIGDDQAQSFVSREQRKGYEIKV